MTLHMGNISPTHGATEIKANSFRIGQRVYRRFLKPTLDFVIVFAALPIVIPVIAILALIVWLDGGNPFYSQQRIGKNGKIYRIWKLRTMVHDADRRLDTLLASNPEARAEWDLTQKLRKDPRITRVGALLRRTSMDELPQLWNVLRGEMSLVGPRPMMPCQRSLYPGNDYEALRPGITGPWQVSKRNNSSFADRAAYDSLYCERLSLMTDIRLLAATFRVVLRGTGY